MKSALAALLIFVSAASFSHGEPGDAPGQRVKKLSRFSSQRSLSYGKYSSRLNVMIGNAGTLEITGEQKEKLNGLRQEYVFPMAREENESAAVRMKAMKMLSDPSFSREAVKKELEKVRTLDESVAYKYVDALSALRDTIGKENYARINEPLFGREQDLVQMRGRDYEKRKEILVDELEKKSPAPAEDTDGQDKDEAGTEKK